MQDFSLQRLTCCFWVAGTAQCNNLLKRPFDLCCRAFLHRSILMHLPLNWRRSSIISVQIIVVGGQLFAIASGPLHMYTVVYVHRVYILYVRYVHCISSHPQKEKFPKMWPANNFGTDKLQCNERFGSTYNRSVYRSVYYIEVCCIAVYLDVHTSVNLMWSLSETLCRNYIKYFIDTLIFSN